jgi:hypothetical protein
MKNALFAALAAATLSACVATPQTVQWDQAQRMDQREQRAAQAMAQDWRVHQNDGAPIIMHIGCNTVVLTHNESDSCMKDEKYAAAMPNGANGDRRATYDGCYKKRDGMLELRWVDGVPRGAQHVTRKPFPENARTPLPRSCKFPSRDFMVIPDRFLRY